MAINADLWLPTNSWLMIDKMWSMHTVMNDAINDMTGHMCHCLKQVKNYVLLMSKVFYVHMCPENVCFQYNCIQNVLFCWKGHQWHVNCQTAVSDIKQVSEQNNVSIIVQSQWLCASIMMGLSYW